MTCEHCGAGLPAFALFCGECGRSVAARPLAAPGTAVVEPPAMPLTDAVAAAVRVASEPAVLPEPAPVPVPAPEPESESEPGHVTLPPPVPVSVPVSVSVPAAAPPPAPEPTPSLPQERVLPCTACGLVPEVDDLYCAECGSALAAQTRIIDALPVAAAHPVPPMSPASPARPAAPPAPAAPPPPASSATPVAAPVAERDLDLDDESTRIVPRRTGGARFVLQFSTGESYTVLGSGLAGRNPRPEPGEYVDHLVPIVDPGRSVSKTHFEFGQEAGVFWVADRHSGNGTVIREPGADPRPCTPGHRYPVVRGTRIDIGEQFVIVS